MRQRLACAASHEWITSTKTPQLALRTRAARNVILERSGLIGLLGITTTRRGLRIEFVSVVNDVQRSVTTTCDVQLVVDNAVTESAGRMRVRVGGCEVGPRICDWIVLPCGILRARYVSSVITGDDVDHPRGRDVAASSKATHVRHVRASAP